jgi:hypothetical protein
MSASHTSERIRKLIRAGLAFESIAKKIGRPGPAGVERVQAEWDRELREVRERGKAALHMKEGGSK